MLSFSFARLSSQNLFLWNDNNIEVPVHGRSTSVHHKKRQHKTKNSKDIMRGGIFDGESKTNPEGGEAGRDSFPSKSQSSSTFLEEDSALDDDSGDSSSVSSSSPSFPSSTLSQDVMILLLVEMFFLIPLLMQQQHEITFLSMTCVTYPLISHTLRESVSLISLLTSFPSFKTTVVRFLLLCFTFPCFSV
jgi:hypothetical protein